LHIKIPFTMFSQKANEIFQDVIKTYKVLNTVDQPFKNKYDKNEDLLHIYYIENVGLILFNGPMKILLETLISTLSMLLN
jgi:hypothetical protein